MGLENVDVHSASDWRGAGDVLILDVRDPDEWEEGTIEGSLQIPQSELVASPERLEAYRDHRILCLCAAGVRSRKVARWLVKQGFARVYNIQGGIRAWAMHGLPGMIA